MHTQLHSQLFGRILKSNYIVYFVHFKYSGIEWRRSCCCQWWKWWRRQKHQVVASGLCCFDFTMGPSSSVFSDEVVFFLTCLHTTYLLYNYLKTSLWSWVWNSTHFWFHEYNIFLCRHISMSEIWKLIGLPLAKSGIKSTCTQLQNYLNTY